MSDLDPTPEQHTSLMSPHLEYLRQIQTASAYKCNKHNRGILQALTVIQESSDAQFQLILDKVSDPSRLLGEENLSLPPLPPDIEKQLHGIMQRFYDDYQHCVDWDIIRSIFTALLKIISAMKQNKTSHEIFVLFSKYVGEIAMVPGTLAKGMAYVNSLKASLATDYGSMIAQDLGIFAAKLESVMMAITLIMHSLRDHLLQPHYTDIHQAIIRLSPDEAEKVAPAVQPKIIPDVKDVKTAKPNNPPAKPKETKKIIPNMHLEAMTERELAERADSILDLFNAKKITKEQMKANLQELGF